MIRAARGVSVIWGRPSAQMQAAASDHGHDGPRHSVAHRTGIYNYLPSGMRHKGHDMEAIQVGEEYDIQGHLNGMRGRNLLAVRQVCEIGDHEVAVSY